MAEKINPRPENVGITISEVMCEDMEVSHRKKATNIETDGKI
jgi:hypothetical protein